jgi:Fibronectin type III domain
LIFIFPEAPTAPRNLSVIDIKQNSIDLVWRRPSEINAPSLTYKLWCNEKWINIDDNTTLNDYVYYKLKNLEPFTTYSIRVIAYTRNSSEPSGGLVLRTKIGVPDRMNQPMLENLRNKSLKLSWKPPMRLRGNLEFYQLNVSISRQGEEIFALYRINGRKQSCLINLDQDDNQEVSFYIRGVNIKEHDSDSVVDSIKDSVYCYEAKEKFSESEYLFLYGEWSMPIVHLSFYTGLLNSIYSSSIVITVIICILLSLLSFFTYLIVKLYRKIQKISNIKAIYPEGLNPNDPTMFYMQEGSLEGLKNLDLIKNHALTDIMEEEISQENRNNTEDMWECKKICEVINQHENNNVVYHPLMKKSITHDEGVCNSFFFTGEKFFSLPSSPIRSHNLSKGKTDVGYMKMHKPRFLKPKSITRNNNNAEGYLDMTGNSPEKFTLKNNSMEIKSFIENTSKNDGYIDRRSVQKNPFPVSASGYVAFKKS